MSEEEEILPSREKCQELVESFASVTKTDTALAQFFLQDRNWSLEASLDAYYEECRRANLLSQEDNGDVMVTFESGLKDILSDSNMKFTTEPPKKLKFLTWNLDGLDDRCLRKRTKAVVKVIQDENPDVVNLQELIPTTYSYIAERLIEYQGFPAGIDDYFTATFIKITTVIHDDNSTIEFPHSQMGRNLLSVESHTGNLKLKILNSHLESTKEFAHERTHQLRDAFSNITKTNRDVTVIFGGDLNLRDVEVDDVGLPPDVRDMWEVCGQRPECQYTWDMQRNSNKEFPGRFKPKCRFDRVYVRSCGETSIKPVHFGLVGIQKVIGTQSFPSDHWGITVSFNIVNKKTPTAVASTDRKVSSPYVPAKTKTITYLDLSGCSSHESKSFPSDFKLKDLQSCHSNIKDETNSLDSSTSLATTQSDCKEKQEHESNVCTPQKLLNSPCSSENKECSVNLTLESSENKSAPYSDDSILVMEISPKQPKNISVIDLDCDDED